MATKKAADSTLYHVSSKGFWKKFRDAVVVNPEISSGLPIASLHRRPTPASRPEKYSTPASKASDLAENPYWKRDVRRAYPQLSMITQSELSSLLVEHAKAPAIATADAGKDVAFASQLPSVDLTEAITSVTATQKVYTEGKLPPSPPTPFKRWKPTRAPDAPHDPSAPFTMELYR